MGRKTPAFAVTDFRERHRLDQEAVDTLFGFSSKGRACRRWEAEGGPYYVTLLMAYADAYGIERMEKLAAAPKKGKRKAPKTPAAAVTSFREKHRLDQASLDRLFGFTSGGRATRLWEAGGAPYYVSILIDYAETFGLAKMEELAASRELEDAA